METGPIPNIIKEFVFFTLTALVYTAMKVLSGYVTYSLQ